MAVIPTPQWPNASPIAPTTYKIRTTIASRTSRLIHSLSVIGFFICKSVAFFGRSKYDYRFPMPRSVLILILAFTVVSFASCSTGEPAKPGPPPFVARSTTLAVTNGIKVLTNVALPQGFAPIPSRPPMWMQNGEEIGVVGTQRGHTIMYGLGGAAWRTGRILAAETGPGAAEEGTIADVGVSPNGLTLATAMVAPGGDRVDVIIRDLIATGPGNVIANFNGRLRFNFDELAERRDDRARAEAASGAAGRIRRQPAKFRSPIRTRQTPSRRPLALTDCS